MRWGEKKETREEKKRKFYFWVNEKKKGRKE